MNTRSPEGMAQGSADDAPLWSDRESTAPGPRQRQVRAGFRILVVEPLAAHRDELVHALRRAGFEVTATEHAAQALDQALRTASFHLVLTELRQPQGSGLQLLARLRAACPHTAVFILTGQPSISSSVSALKLGAAEYLTKPLSLRRLVQLCQARCDAAPRYLPNALLAVPQGVELAGLRAHGPRMQAVLHTLERLAATAAPVLLLGEAGSGKARAARALHRRSERAGAPLQVLRTTGPQRVVEGLEEQLLDALRGRGGTLYIDEVAGLPRGAQALLADALRCPEPAVRLICGSRLTEAALAEQLEVGLWSLLRGCALGLPPLRERREDILPLALQLLAELSAPLGRTPPLLSPEAQRLLEEHPWPGNVSELRAVLEHAVLRTAGSTIEPAGLPLSLSLPGGRRRPRSLEIPVGTPLHEVERRLLHSTLEHCEGNRSKAASTLGISRSCLYDMLQRYQVPQGVPRPRPAGEPADEAGPGRPPREEG